jgi:hypothetical protein
MYLKLKAMKKVIYVLMLSLVCSLTVVSCTEEDVAPKKESDNGGGSPIISDKN